MRHAAIALAQLLALAALPCAAEPPPASGPLVHPDGPGAFDWRLGAGVIVDVLPERVVDSATRQYPRAALQLRYGLPRGFSADLKLNAVVVANEAQAGAAWSFAAGPVRVAILGHAAIWYGYVGATGFDTSGWGVTTYPGLAVGASAGGSRFTLAGELIAVHHQHVTFGTAGVDRGRTYLAGFLVTLTAETPVGRGLVYYGASAIRADPDYQLWLAFSDNRYAQLYPRFFAGYAF